jgi:hypothetical protein
MRRVLDNPTAEEYTCVMKDCNAKYDLKDIGEMYEETISKMVCKFSIQRKPVFIVRDENQRNTGQKGRKTPHTTWKNIIFCQVRSNQEDFIFFQN